MLIDAVRVLPYALGIVASPSAAGMLRVRGRRRSATAIAISWTFTVLLLSAVGLLIDFDGRHSSLPGGTTIIVAAGVVWWTRMDSMSARTSRARPPDNTMTKGFRAGAHAALTEPKNVALAIAIGVSVDNTGGVASAELRNIAVFALFASMGLWVAGRATVPPVATRRGFANRTLLGIAAVGVAIDGLLIIA